MSDLQVSTIALRKRIRHILKDADLHSLSSRKVRLQLEEEFDTDLTSRKQEIDDIVMELITSGLKNNDDDSDEQSESDLESEYEKEKDSSEDESDLVNEPPQKKIKTVNRKQNAKKEKDCSDEDSDSDNIDDEALARKLQEEEVQSRSRAVKKMSNKKEKKEPKKSKQIVRTKKETTYTRKCILSSELAEVVGANEMARHDVVKKMWGIVRERNLFDPKNKQFAICDDQLQKVFGTKRVRMFGMMKYLKNHIKDVK